MSETLTPKLPILLVEDDMLTLHMLVISLEKEGYAVMTASGVEEGYSAFLRVKPALVISDFHLGDGDAHELASRIWEHTPGQPIVLMSGSMPTVVNRSLYAGYLHKPFKREDLLSSIRNNVPR